MNFRMYVTCLSVLSVIFVLGCSNPSSSPSLSDDSPSVNIDDPRSALAGIPDLALSDNDALSSGISRSINTADATVGNSVAGVYDESGSVLNSVRVGYMMVEILQLLENSVYEDYDFTPDGAIRKYTHAPINSSTASSLHIDADTIGGTTDYYVDYEALKINTVVQSGIDTGYEYSCKTSYILSDTGSKSYSYCRFKLLYLDENDLDDLELHIAVYSYDGSNYSPYMAGLFKQDANKNQNFETLYYSNSDGDDWKYKEYRYDKSSGDSQMFSTGVKSDTIDIDSWSVLVMDEYGGGMITTGYDNDETVSNMRFFDADFYRLAKITVNDLGSSLPSVSDITASYNSADSYNYLYRYLDTNADTSGLADITEDGVTYKRLQLAAAIGTGSGGYTFDNNSNFTYKIESELYSEYAAQYENLDGTEGSSSTSYKDSVSASLLIGGSESNITMTTLFGDLNTAVD